VRAGDLIFSGPTSVALIIPNVAALRLLVRIVAGSDVTRVSSFAASPSLPELGSRISQH